MPTLKETYFPADSLVTFLVGGRFDGTAAEADLVHLDISTARETIPMPAPYTDRKVTEVVPLDITQSGIRERYGPFNVISSGGLANNVSMFVQFPTVDWPLKMGDVQRCMEEGKSLPTVFSYVEGAKKLWETFGAKMKEATEVDNYSETTIKHLRDAGVTAKFKDAGVTKGPDYNLLHVSEKGDIKTLINAATVDQLRTPKTDWPSGFFGYLTVQSPYNPKRNLWVCVGCRAPDSLAGNSTFFGIGEPVVLYNSKKYVRGVEGVTALERHLKERLAGYGKLWQDLLFAVATELDTTEQPWWPRIDFPEQIRRRFNSDGTWSWELPSSLLYLEFSRNEIRDRQVYQPK